MITISQGQASRRIFNSQKKLVGYCTKIEDGWTAVIFQEGPKDWPGWRSPIARRSGDTVIQNKKFRNLRSTIEFFLDKRKWL